MTALDDRPAVPTVPVDDVPAGEPPITILANGLVYCLLPAVPCPLSDRQTEVVQLAAEGLTRAAIGRRLYMTEHTVKPHPAGTVVGAQSTTHLVAIALRKRWIR